MVDEKKKAPAAKKKAPAAKKKKAAPAANKTAAANKIVAAKKKAAAKKAPAAKEKAPAARDKAPAAKQAPAAKREKEKVATAVDRAEAVVEEATQEPPAKQTDKGQAKKMIQVQLFKSTAGRLKKHRACVAGLGLRRIGHSVEVEDTPSVRGMIDRVNYMVRVVGE